MVSKENATECSYDKLVIPKTFVRRREEIRHNKHRTSLGYKEDIMDVSFHIPDFAEPIQFQSVGFLDGFVPEKLIDANSITELDM